MKKLLALLLALVMVFALAACGDKADKEEANEPEEPEFTVQEAEIAGYKITVTGAKFYKPYDTSNGAILLYFDFTNNTDAETYAMKGVFWTAKQDDKVCKGLDYLEEMRPELYNSGYTKIAPGETTQCMEVVQVADEAGGPVEITFADMYHQDKTTLVVSIDYSTLEEYTK